MEEIRYIKNEDIDLLKWDACIRQSPNGLIYVYSWFLNIVSPGWEALVLGDYTAVMPLTYRRKWGIYYLYQPSFCAEAGIFSIRDTDAGLVHRFLRSIPEKFRYVDICLNRSNLFTLTDYSFIERIDYVLPLQLSYEEIKAAYSDNHTRNIQKARKRSLIVEEVPIQDAINLVSNHIKNNPFKKDSDKAMFSQLFSRAKEKGGVICLGVKNIQGDLLSCALFFHAQQIWYYLLAGSTEEGKRSGAAHLLVDVFIRQHAGTEHILDFEGSDVESVAFFYRGFGSKKIIYPSLRINQLPVWMQLFKR
jgi:hypothetical protein